MECDLRISLKPQLMDNGQRQLITVQDSKFGKGTFATRNISKGSPIITIRGEKLDFSDSLSLGERESYCLQVGIDSYIIAEVPFRYSNHSCDPNRGVKSQLELVALRPIAEGEEVLWDYSSSMLERHWTMRCHCGSPSCRQLIADFDLLPKHVQEYYLQLGIVLPFIVRYLEQQWTSAVLVYAR